MHAMGLSLLLFQTRMECLGHIFQRPVLSKPIFSPRDPAVTVPFDELGAFAVTTHWKRDCGSHAPSVLDTYAQIRQRQGHILNSSCVLQAIGKEKQ